MSETPLLGSTASLADEVDTRNYEGLATRNQVDAVDIDSKAEAVRLTWKDINVYAEPDTSIIARLKNGGIKTETHILQNVSGVAQSGRVLAIMGSSGAGKSTLLNALTWRNRQNLRIDGEIKVNGVALEERITNVSAYVQQDDLFVGALTVREHLIFSARLRMGPDVLEKDRILRVEEVITQMGLTKCKDTMIGFPGRTKTISGGERKRLSFASELLTNPHIMFCDEPTSGLDSYLAKVLVECLRNISEQGCTVLCTIHQPSSEVFELFDDLLLLALGKSIFMGPREDATAYYAGYGLPCPVNYNPADHFIMKISVIPGSEKKCRQDIAEFAEYYEESPYSREALKMIEEKPEGIHELQEIPMASSPYKATFFQQFGACLGRATITSYRNPQLLRVRFCQSTVVALITGLVYLRLPFGKSYSAHEVRNIDGAMFLVLINLTYSYMFGVIDTFPMELPIFRREHFNGMYNTAAYFLSKSAAELPMYIGIPLTFAAIVYFMIGLYPGPVEFFIFCGVCIMVVNISVSFGIMISCMSPTLAIALALAPPMVLPLLLFGGFFLATKAIPGYLLWLKYVSWFLYSNELLNINQWKSVEHIACDPHGASNATSCLMSNGNDVLAEYSFDVANIYRDVGALFALLIGFRLIAFFVLLYRMRDSTR